MILASGRRIFDHIDPDPPGFWGLVPDRAKECKLAGKPFTYVDHAYFHRGWDNRTFRVIRDDIHLTRVLDRPDDRLKKFNVEIAPWRRSGSRVVVIPPSHFIALHHDGQGWLAGVLERLKGMTDRPVFVKDTKVDPLAKTLQDAWCVVSFCTVAAVEAALMGVPVFSTEHCPSWPISGRLEDLETPHYPDRLAWACSLSYATWTLDEMHSMKWPYDYGF